MAGPLQLIYNVMGRNLHTRRMMRWGARKVRSTIHCPNPYADLLALHRAHRPDAILDVGAYVGRTVLKFADEFGNTPIYAFEPTPESFQQLQQRMAGWDKVKIFNVALSDQAGKKRFFKNQSAETNSLLDNAAGNKEAFGAVTAHLDSIEVQTVRLDDWAAANLPAGRLLLKVDVQGAEGLLLDGGRETVRARVMAFYCETAIVPLYETEPDFFSLHERLTREFGFVLAQIYPCQRDARGKALYTDALWIQPKLLT